MVEARKLDGPDCADDEVLIKVVSASVNPSDWQLCSGLSGVIRVTTPFVLGHDCAGIVTAVGSECLRIEVGDEVWTNLASRTRQNNSHELKLGAFAEYVAIAARQVAAYQIL